MRGAMVLSSDRDSGTLNRAKAVSRFDSDSIATVDRQCAWVYASAVCFRL